MFSVNSELLQAPSSTFHSDYSTALITSSSLLSEDGPISLDRPPAYQPLDESNNDDDDEIRCSQTDHLIYCTVRRLDLVERKFGNPPKKVF